MFGIPLRWKLARCLENDMGLEVAPCNLVIFGARLLSGRDPLPTGLNSEGITTRAPMIHPLRFFGW
jgi:hypothetical protein